MCDHTDSQLMLIAFCNSCHEIAVWDGEEVEDKRPAVVMDRTGAIWVRRDDTHYDPVGPE